MDDSPLKVFSRAFIVGTQITCCLFILETHFAIGETHFPTGENQVTSRGSRGGVVVTALAFHQCGLGSILGPGVICGLSLLLVLSLLREVFLWVLRFSPLLKNQHSKIQLDLESVPNQYSHAKYL